MSSKNNNMTTAKPTALLPVAAIATLAIITIQFAYAQSESPETIWFGEPDENTDMLLTEVLNTTATRLAEPKQVQRTGDER